MSLSGELKRDPADPSLGDIPMLDNHAPEAIIERANLIAEILKAMQSGGSESSLKELLPVLQKNLSDLLATFERNPGLDAAATDLYGAASAVVCDFSAGSQPPARKRRLLSEAQGRFAERISIAVRSDRNASADWRSQEIFIAA